MKKVFTVLLFFVTGICFAQNAYYDSFWLAENGSLLSHYVGRIVNFSGINAREKDLLTRFAAFYNDPWNTEIYYNDLPKLRRLLTENRLVDLINSTITDSNEIRIEDKSFEYEMKKKGWSKDEFNALSSSTIQTNLIDAIGMIIAERFKTGITTHYINVFHDKLKQNAFLGLLLPDTYNLALTFNYFNFEDLGKELKIAVESDLNNVPKNLMNALVDDKFVNMLFSKDPVTVDEIKKNDYYICSKFTITLLEGFQKGMHPIDVLSLIENSCEKNFNGVATNKIYNALYGLVHFLNLIQNNLRTIQAKGEGEDPNKYSWIGMDELLEMVKNEKSLNLFLFLIYKENETFFSRPLNEFMNVRPGAESKKLKDIIYSFGKSEKKDQFIELFGKFKEIDEIVKNKTNNSQDYFRIINANLDVFEILAHIAYKFSYLSSDSASAENQYSNLKFFKIGKNILKIYEYSFTKEYSAIFSNAIVLLKTIFAEDSSKLDDGRFFSFILKYGSFLESLANAKNSTDMKNMISSIILPPESFEEKRNNIYTWTITAHPGLLGGFEIITKSKTPASTVAFSAPLGLEVSWGSKTKKKYSDGFFLQFFDLGAIVSYRFKTSNSDDKKFKGLPESVTFKQVFSLGISYVHGFDSPLTFGLGWQWMPYLRNITDTEGNVINEKPTHRFFIRISWDIPLIRIVTRERARID